MSECQSGNRGPSASKVRLASSEVSRGHSSLDTSRPPKEKGTGGGLTKEEGLNVRMTE